MKINFIRSACLGVTATAAMLLAGCASTPPKTSGFLSSYSELHEEKTPDGGSRLVYMNPAFTPANYDAIWLDPVTYYPEPQPTDQVSMATLTQIRTYIDQALRQKIGRQVRLVDRAGPHVAHVRIAITAVGTESQALKAYQYIPVALVITGAKAAVEGGRPQNASIALETQVIDSVTGQTLYAAVRGGTGEKVESASQGQGGVQASSLRPLIDAWTTGAARQIRQHVRASQ